MASKLVFLIVVCVSLISLTGGGNKNDVPSVKILVVGKTGSGKSTLINGLFGSEKAKVDGHDTLESDSVTKDVECFDEVYQSASEKEQKFNVTICDSPGFQDTSYSDKEYIEKLQSKCNNPDLVLYVVSMKETRWTIDQVETIARVNEALGKEVWNNTLLVLTFANKVNSVEKKNEFFKKFIQSLDKIGVKADNMPVALAGHLSKGEGDHLPKHNITYWYTELLIEGVKRVNTKGFDALMFLTLFHKDKVHLRSNESDIVISWTSYFLSFFLKVSVTPILFFEDMKAVICYVFNSKISMAVIAIVIFTISVAILPFGWLFASVVGVIPAATGYIIVQNITGEFCN